MLVITSSWFMRLLKPLKSVTIKKTINYSKAIRMYKLYSIWKRNKWTFLLIGGIKRSILAIKNDFTFNINPIIFHYCVFLFFYLCYVIPYFHYQICNFNIFMKISILKFRVGINLFILEKFNFGSITKINHNQCSKTSSTLPKLRSITNSEPFLSWTNQMQFSTELTSLLLQHQTPVKLHWWSKLREKYSRSWEAQPNVIKRSSIKLQHFNNLDSTLWTQSN